MTEYAISVNVITTDRWTKYLSTVQSPTFFLHDTVQGIVDEHHAKEIVKKWMAELVQAVEMSLPTQSRVSIGIARMENHDS